VNQRQLSEETTEVTSAQAQQQQLQQQHQQLQQQQLQRRRKHKYEYIDDDDERSVRSDSPLNPGLSQVMQSLNRAEVGFFLTVHAFFASGLNLVKIIFPPVDALIAVLALYPVFFWLSLCMHYFLSLSAIV
jgi:hypothetical protein